MDERVQRFINEIPADKKPMFNELQELILSMYPNAEITISYGVPTYKTGTGWVALGDWKGGVSVYPHGRQPVAAFRKKHPEIKTSAGTINLKINEAIPVDDIKEAIRHAMEYPKTP